MRMRLRRLSLVLLILLALALTVGAAAAIGQAKPGTAKAAALAAVSAAPINPEFVRYQAQFPLGTEQWIGSAFGFGERPAPLDLSYARGAIVDKGLDTYAASYDLRTLGKVTSVKNQNPYGTCWSFASMGSLESCLMPSENLDFSEDNMVLTSGFDASSGSTLYDTGGNIWKSTAYLARWSGPIYESDDTYGDGVTPPNVPVRKHVQDVSWVPQRSSSTDNDNVKYLVSTYGGIYVGMSWQGSSSGSSYYNATTHAYYYNGSANANHGVLIVGWDDNYPASNFATTPPGNGAFIVKNSWGAAWGDSGYFYASYYDTVFGKTSPFAAFNGVQSTSNYSRIYQYDPLGWVNGFGGSSETGWIANVFTAQATASLSAVGFYAGAMNTSYEVWAGSSLATLSLRTSGTLATMGYHTVTLPATVAVTSGQPFVVAAKLTTPGDLYPMPIEYPYANYSSGATAQAGQSYYSSSGTSWIDLTTWNANANVCLKAFTTGEAPPSDEDIPGVVLPSSPAAGTLNSSSDVNDVYNVYLNAGDTISAGISGAGGTSFYLFLFPPGTAHVANHGLAVASATTAGYPDNLTYIATATGLYYVDAYAASGSGTYSIAYTVTPALSDDDIPGLAIPSSPFSGSLARGSDNDDVFSVHMDAGQSMNATLTGAGGTDFDLYLYPPGATTVASTSHVAHAAGTGYPDSFTYQATQTGTYYLDVYAYSGTGSYTITYSIGAADNTPPTTSVNGIPAGWSNANVTATFSASDAGSGVANTEYSLDGGGYVHGTSVTVTASGTHTLLYRSVDNAGNIETAKNATIRIERGMPSSSVAGIPAGWSRAAVTASFSATDTESGIAYTECSLDGAAYVRGNGVSVATAGTHALAYRSADNAGNVETAKNVTVRVDPQGPATIALAKVTVKKGKKATFRFAVSDVTPTVSVKIKIYKGSKLKKTLTVGTKPVNTVQTHKWTCSLARGSYTWKVYATDLAGNAQRVIGKKALVVT